MRKCITLQFCQLYWWACANLSFQSSVEFHYSFKPVMRQCVFLTILLLVLSHLVDVLGLELQPGINNNSCDGFKYHQITERWIPLVHYSQALTTIYQVWYFSYLFKWIFTEIINDTKMWMLTTIIYGIVFSKVKLMNTNYYLLDSY